MSTVFIGTTDFAAAVLERLARSDTHRPALVLTRPDRPSGRGRRMTSPPVADSARALGIPLEQPPNVNEPSVAELIAAAVGTGPGAEPATPTGGSHDRWGAGGSDHAVVVCAFGALIKEPLLAEHEILNVHPSLLPRWRGAAPIERAIIAGDQQTGVSIMRLTAGLDSGPVYLTGVEPIRPDDSFASLAARLRELGGELLVRALEERPAVVEQSEDGVTYAEKIGPADRLLDPSRPAIELERVVRALHPHIGARVALTDGTLLGVHRAAVVEVGLGGAGAPGACAAVALGAAVPAEGSHPTEREGRLLLDCTPGVLELLVVQPPGGRAMDAADYMRGHPAPGRR